MKTLKSQNAPRNTQESTSYTALIENVCKTVVLLERSYGADYLSRLLTGFDRFGLRKDEHKELETFGVASDIYSYKVINLIRWMTTAGYLKIVDVDYGNLNITQKGEAFLENPVEIQIPESQLKTPELDVMLELELKQLRREYSEQAEIMPYEVFNNYSMEQIVKVKPEHVTALKMIPGFGQIRINKYGHAILKAVKRVKEDGPGVLLQKKASRQSHQSVKDLFLAGKDIAQIAEERKIKATTIMNYLENLHRAGQIDLCTWIEEQVDPQALHKGTAYFKQTQNPKLEEAFSVLGLDYTTLRMCRLYVANVQSEDAVLALAS